MTFTSSQMSKLGEFMSLTKEIALKDEIIADLKRTRIAKCRTRATFAAFVGHALQARTIEALNEIVSRLKHENALLRKFSGLDADQRPPSTTHAFGEEVAQL